MNRNWNCILRIIKTYDENKTKQKKYIYLFIYQVASEYSLTGVLHTYLRAHTHGLQQTAAKRKIQQPNRNESREKIHTQLIGK